MAMTSAEKSKAYHLREKEKRLNGDPEALKRWDVQLERGRKSYKRWAKSNPDKVKALNLKRRYLIQNSRLETVSRQAVWLRDGGTCQICGIEADFSNWDLDHIFPLSRGGSHSYDNVQLSHPLCNKKKGDSITHWEVS